MELPKDYKGPYLLTQEVDGHKITWTYHPDIHGDLPQYLKSEKVRIGIIQNGEYQEVKK